jgi:hypothetical protein
MVEVHRALTRLALHLLAKRLRIASHIQAIRRGGRAHLQSFDDPDAGALRDSFLPAIAARATRFSALKRCVTDVMKRRGTKRNKVALARRSA